MLLNKHNLAIADLASKDESRYTLTAIRVTPKWTATTNGHYLVTVTLPKLKDSQFPRIDGFNPTNGTTPPFLLHRDDALAIGKSIPRKQSIPVLETAAIGATADGKIQVAVTDLDSPKLTVPRKMDGQFPNIDAVIPNGEKRTLRIGLDAAYLAKLAKSALATCDNGRRHEVTICCDFIDAQSAVKMTATNPETEQEWMAVLMPKRI